MYKFNDFKIQHQILTNLLIGDTINKYNLIMFLVRILEYKLRIT